MKIRSVLGIAIALMMFACGKASNTAGAGNDGLFNEFNTTADEVAYCNGLGQPASLFGSWKKFTSSNGINSFITMTLDRSYLTYSKTCIDSAGNRATAQVQSWVSYIGQTFQINQPVSNSQIIPGTGLACTISLNAKQVSWSFHGGCLNANLGPVDTLYQPALQTHF